MPVERPANWKAIHWTDADIDRLSTFTQEDIQRAIKFWKQHAGILANLLEAKLWTGSAHGKTTPDSRLG